ncbi:unnamed protein product [Periconia digitata]|uniref:Subtelomeric hrmA-associated cluster protein AFUB-079030/YDR124W-like helical bundle domain-containing protein n=1 Tax=Periconia digitata TaxID=1303443 RepID=A0A9W4XNF4_9PLEO|nr:unnamed protein product [Periconia digitata]
MNPHLVGSVYFNDGRLVLKAHPGYEHLFPPGSETVPERPPTPSLSPLPIESGPKPDEATGSSEYIWANTGKRTYPETETEEPISKRHYTEKMQRHQFRVGDTNKLKEFYYIRLNEVGIIALRRIVTEWIRILEPTRLRDYGPYHKLDQYRRNPSLLTAESKDRECEPPWWPRDVPYVEPAHLPAKGLETLGVSLMLLQVSTDKKYQRYHTEEDLISKLHHAANYVVACVPVQKYAMGSDARNAYLKERALQIVLPDLLKATQTFREHYTQVNNSETMSDKVITYEALRKPARKREGKKVKQLMSVHSILNIPSESVS